MSIKARITIWLMGMTVGLSLLLFLFLIAVTRTVTLQTASDQLIRKSQENVRLIGKQDGKLKIEEGFSFYKDGVYSLVYSKGKTLLAGQLPVGFSVTEDFENGHSRLVESGETDYMVLDLWVPVGWEDGLWLRALTEAPRQSYVAINLLIVFAGITLIFLLLAGIGSYFILKKAFHPMDRIMETAEEMGEAKDLTKRIEVSDKKGRKDEFTRLAETFNRLFSRLERSFEAEKQFTSDASHELRTPVSIIRGACELALKYEETPEERRETLTMIHRQSLKMTELIGQLLALTRLEQGTEKVVSVPIRLDQLVQKYVSESVYDSERLVIDQVEPVTVSGDPMLLERVLDNLVSNGFKYGKDNSHVWIRVSARNEEALLQVRDDGIGIAEEDRERIWQRFYQTDTSRNEKGGAGLGLAMVKQIAELHGGYMTLESVPGLGSCFMLHLPIEKEEQ